MPQLPARHDLLLRSCLQCVLSLPISLKQLETAQLRHAHQEPNVHPLLQIPVENIHRELQHCALDKQVRITCQLQLSSGLSPAVHSVPTMHSSCALRYSCAFL